ncbi:MAG: DNA polymerase III subunit beta family protein [Acidiferrobacteraceae bacterium]
MLTIPLNALKALLITAAKNETRYFLNGIHFNVRKHDVLFASGDGHRLNVYRQQPTSIVEPDPVLSLLGEGILPRDYCEQVAKIASPFHDIQLAIFYDSEGRPSARHVDSGLTAPLIDGRYPDYMRVIPRTCSGEVSQFNPAYLGDLAKISKALGFKSNQACIAHNGESAALVRFNNYNLIHVLMPMRFDIKAELIRPVWLDELGDTEATTTTTAAA